MRPQALAYFYARRLRVHAIQELLAGIGVAVAVALVFAVTVANSSVVGSAEAVVHAVIGPADLQLHARGPDGFNAGIARTVNHLPGVKRAAALLEVDATAFAENGRRASLEVAGTDVSLAILDGLAETLPLSTLAPGGIGLSQTTARQLGLGLRAHRQTVRLAVRGRSYTLKVSAVLGREAAGALSQAQIAVMPLNRLQTLTGLSGRVTRILVQSKPGQAAKVRGELQSLAGGRLTVAPADQDITLLKQALHPSSQASTLFAGLSVLLGFLFAFNAMLLTVPERRAAIADLRLDGTSRHSIMQMVCFQALCLGVGASLVGVLLGDALTHGVFRQNPAYLTRAFTLGTGTVVGWRPVAFSLGGGVLATLLASLVPLQDLRKGRPLDAGLSDDSDSFGRGEGRRRRWTSTATLVLLALATALLLLAPSAAIVACIALALATMLAVPVAIDGLLAMSERLSAHQRHWTALPLALASLRSTALRSIALAATGAVALFGSVALGSARDDLLRGIDGYTANYAGSASIWVVNPNDNQATSDFPAGNNAARLAQVPGVASVATFRGSFLDVGARRIWVIGWASAATPQLLDGQIIHGELAGARRAVRAADAITVSDQLASEMHVGVGGKLTLPTPSGPRAFRVAATTTNFGWTPGAVVVGARAYAQAWETTAPSALGVMLTPRANPTLVRNTIAARLGADSGLDVLIAHQREDAIERSASEGLGQLGEISTLLVIAAVLAMASALGSSIWQRRGWLAELRLDGASRRRVQLVLLLESVLLLSAGCLTGAVVGVYGQVVIDAYLKRVTGFPVASIASGQRPVEIFAIVVCAVLAIVALPGWMASGAPATFALEE